MAITPPFFGRGLVRFEKAMVLCFGRLETHGANLKIKLVTKYGFLTGSEKFDRQTYIQIIDVIPTELFRASGRAKLLLIIISGRGPNASGFEPKFGLFRAIIKYTEKLIKIFFRELF